MVYDLVIEKFKPLSYYLKMFLFVFTMFMSLSYVIYLLGEIHKVTLNYQEEPVNVIDDKFLSFGIDTIKLAEGVDKVGFDNQLLLNLTTLLSPAYLRLGGTMSDRLIFTENSTHDKGILPLITINQRDWIAVNQFCLKVGARLLFDLNALLRIGDKWDSSNAVQLIEFTKQMGFDHNVDWQLGNEPNSFPHVFNVSIAPEQLSEDFMELKRIVKSLSPNSWVVGPDTTRPQPNRPECVKYMKQFLLGFGGGLSLNLNAIAWHQYYLNGRLATLNDFWDYRTFNLLQSQIDTMRENIDSIRKDVPMWLSETSSAYGGGAPGLSDSYAGTPLWIDKLGVSALKGINVVVRQSLIGGRYSLLSDEFKPHPDWWVSLLFKRLVGYQVLNITVDNGDLTRLYCHCSASEIRKNGSVTIFGSNLSQASTKLRFKGDVFNKTLTIEEYIILPKDQNRLSQEVTLNNQLLEYKGQIPTMSPKIYVNQTYVYMPSYSVAFWVIHGVELPLCY